MLISDAFAWLIRSDEILRRLAGLRRVDLALHENSWEFGKLYEDYLRSITQIKGKQYSDSTFLN